MTYHTFRMFTGSYAVIATGGACFYGFETLTDAERWINARVNEELDRMED